ncbi:MAG TPA: ABC transporter ATP-binding protein [Xanthobacteraceae bacterium]
MALVEHVSTTRPAVEIDGVTLNYFTPERETLALANVSLSVAPGEFIAIVGSSGCGKSTLLSIVSGLLPPSRGCIRIDGNEVTKPSPRVGYMFQKDTLLDWRTILDNVAIGAELLGRDMKASRRRAEDLLVRYGLGEFLHSLPSQLSGGMRQRAALARTLCCEPDLLLLDEPFSALDYQTRLALSEEVAGILSAERKTVILVTHDIGEAISMAHRVIVMSRRPGRIKSEHRIEFPSFGPTRPTPFQARKCDEFSGYFQRIWDELDIHQIQ